MSEDNSLLRQLQASPRDEALWATLYGQLYPRVYVLTFHLCSADGDLAQDVTQDAFVRFITSGAIRKVASKGAAVGYLRAIVRNLMRDYYRKRMQHPTISTTSVQPDDLERALERVIRKTVADVDLLIVPHLRADERHLLRLTIEGHTVAEVAESMGLTYSAAAVRLHRLRKRLRVVCKETDFNSVVVDK